MEKAMKKIIILLIILITLLGCELEPEYEWDDYEVPTGSSYPTYSEYETLLDNLQQESVVNKSVIDQQLTTLGISLSYEYSYYQSGDYVCYTFNWNYWSSTSYEFIYYIVVDIWTTSGNFNRSMCSYYGG